MKNLSNWDWESVKIVLSEGKTHANELKQQLNPIMKPSSREACLLLTEMLITSYDNALALINDDSFTNPPNSAEDCPKTSQEAKNIFKGHCVSKKRKRERSEQVLVRCDKGFEGPMNDGYNWRKYGQKVILNAAHPRAYYRCTHRHTQSCLATKQVQRADNDPSILQVIYVGKHSCSQGPMKNGGEFDGGPKKTSVVGEAEEGDSSPSFGFTTIADEPKEDLKVESFSKEDECFFASDCLVNDFSMGRSFIRSFGSDFGEMLSSPTRVGEFMFGDLDTHFLDSCW